MGKSKLKRHRAYRDNPTGLAQSDTVSQLTMGMGPVSNTVVNLLEKLQSPSEEERQCACSTLASLVCQPEAVPHLMRGNVVKVLGPLLTDPSMTVRQAAIGTLRNLSVDGGSQVCELMVKQDVMTSLTAVFQQYGANWSPTFPDENKLGHDVRTDIFLQAVHLLWNLCEMNEVAVTVANAQSILPVLLPCMDPNIYGWELAITTGQCMYTMTEHNPDAARLLSTPHIFTSLQQMIAAQHETKQQLLLRTLATGILYNVSVGQAGVGCGDQVACITQMLAVALQEDVTTQLAQLAQAVVTLVAQNGAAETETQQIRHREIEAEIAQVQYVLTAQQIALEIITNLCCTDGSEDEEWEDELSVESFGSSDGEEGMEEEVTGAENAGMVVVGNDDLPQQIQEAFAGNNMVAKVLSKVIPPDTQVVEALSSNVICGNITSSLRQIQIRALLCINNLVDILESESLGGTDKLHATWISLTQLSSTQKDMEIMEAVTAAMRAVAQKLSKDDPTKLSSVSSDDVRYLCMMGTQCEQAEVRANAIRITSIIGCSLVKLNATHPILKDLGLLFYEVAKGDGELWVSAEALDAMFDVFSQDETDPVLRDIALVEKLKSLVPALKSKMQQQKSHLGEHLAIVSTARSNLMRFIKYKQNRL